MKNDLKKIEELLRDAKPKKTNIPGLRKKVWQKVLKAQRERRKSGFIVELPPWIWALGSIIIIVLFIMFILFLK